MLLIKTLKDVKKSAKFWGIKTHLPDFFTSLKVFFLHALHTNGTLINMRLDPSIFNEERGIRNFMSLIKSASDLDIYHIQFNVVKTKTLLAAQKDPDKYRNLLVRVAGYTAYFVELAKPVQDEIISR